MADYRERFWAKVDAGGDCWEWTAAIDDGGYGRFRIDLHAFRAHRVAYVLLVGSIGSGLVLDHLCRNRRCVNPDHLEPVPNAVNIRRGALAATNRTRGAARTHCRRGGHALSGTNLKTTKQGRRECRACRADARRRARAEGAAA